MHSALIYELQASPFMQIALFCLGHQCVYTMHTIKILSSQDDTTLGA